MSYKSRATRFDEAIAKVVEARGEIEELRDELQNWRDNIPENLLNGSKADEVQTAIDDCESIISDLENAEGNTPSFPSMF